MILIKVDNVSKKFCRRLKRSLWYAVKDIIAEIFCITGGGNKLRKHEFRALDNISFELRRGECLGLIGHNGAGKSTLLKLLSGLFNPDSGRISMTGDVCGLIELGAGFNPILTGRENVYVNASVLGIPKREVDKVFDEIVEFAEVGDFIDTPVQNYSSGMKVRLGFAVAAQMKPDVLLIDEVLAVGDLAFRIKCFNKIEELMKSCAVVIVSHNMAALARITSKCIVLNKGEISFQGNPEDAIQHYYSLVDTEKLSAKHLSAVNEAEVKEVSLINSEGRDTDVVGYNVPVIFSFCAKIPREYKKFIVSVIFVSQGMELVAQCNSKFSDVLLENDGTPKQIKISIPKLLLKPGKYSINLTIFDESNQRYLYWDHHAKNFRVEGGFVGGSSVQFDAEWKIV